MVCFLSQLWGLQNIGMIAAMNKMDIYIILLIHSDRPGIRKGFKIEKL